MGRSVRRYVRPGIDAAVWISSGRWGPKRVRVTQCWAVLKAEDVYTGLLRANASRTRPGERGWCDWELSGREPIRVAWELRPNAVWRFGRVFLTCPRCQGRATRIYLPTGQAAAACRRCWGLSYTSRQERNYKAGRSHTWGVLLSPLTYAMCRAEDACQARAEAAASRYAERRAILTRSGRSALPTRRARRVRCLSPMRRSPCCRRRGSRRSYSRRGRRAVT